MLQVAPERDVATEVNAILSQYMPHALPSPTAAALSADRAVIIFRPDHANDDEPLVEASATA